MNLFQDEKFDEYVESFKNLSLRDKQDEVISILKQDIAFLSEVLSKNESSAQVLYNKEISDTQNEEYTNDDFAEAVFVYSHAIRELIASYVEIKEEM